QLVEERGQAGDTSVSAPGQEFSQDVRRHSVLTNKSNRLIRRAPQIQSPGSPTSDVPCGVTQADCECPRTAVISRLKQLSPTPQNGRSGRNARRRWRRLNRETVDARCCLLQHRGHSLSPVRSATKNDIEIRLRLFVGQQNGEVEFS